MSIRYADVNPYLRQAIVERVAAGARLSAVCREAGMPCVSSVNGWARKDAGFAEALRIAYLQGDARRGLEMDEAAARALVMRMSAGARLDQALSEPGMPTRRTLRRWRATDAAFAEALNRQIEGRRAVARERLTARWRPYDPAVGERLYVALWKGAKLRPLLTSDRAFPSRAVLARWRRENPEFDAMMRHVLGGWRARRARGRALCTPQLTARIAAGIQTGGSLRSLSRKPGMPSARAMYAWMAERPDFARAVEQACQDRADWYADQILDAARRVDLLGAAATRRMIGKLSAQETRLRKWRGWKRRTG